MTERFRACRIHIRVEPSRIIYINGVLDSYEGIGIMRTADEAAGKVIIYTTEDSRQTVLDLLDSLAKEGVRINVDSVDYEDVIG